MYFNIQIEEVNKKGRPWQTAKVPQARIHEGSAGVNPLLIALSFWSEKTCRQAGVEEPLPCGRVLRPDR
jgi:hypothetical protein